MSIIDDVRDAVIAIPAGFVASYGDIGRRIGAGPRQVGRAMSLLDDSVPWWRVVRADGTPASCHGGRAPVLLNDEGTPMLGARVDMMRARQQCTSPADGAEGELMSWVTGKGTGSEPVICGP
jgi:alkylated DNA nucleotide flippase Atl1